MNLKKDRNGVLRALTEMEGERWLARQKAGQFKGYSVFDAIKDVESVKEHAGEDFSVAVIYGNDGWNRYRVTAAGEVQFIELQAFSKKAVEKARQLGFEVV